MYSHRSEQMVNEALMNCASDQFCFVPAIDPSASPHYSGHFPLAAAFHIERNKCLTICHKIDRFLLSIFFLFFYHCRLVCFARTSHESSMINLREDDPIEKAASRSRMWSRPVDVHRRVSHCSILNLFIMPHRF